nr:hypothetical protein [Tanacetum cinerariifolium]
MPPRKNRTLNEIHEQELEDHVMATPEERFNQFVDQLSDRMDQLMNMHGNRNSHGTDDKHSKNSFGEDDDSSSDEQSGRRPRQNQREDNRAWESGMRRTLAFEKQNRRVGSSSSSAITGASGLGNVASHFAPKCKKAGKRHLFVDPEGDDDAAYEEYEEASVYDEEPECEEKYVSGDVGLNLVVRRSCLTPKADGDDWLKHNIFQSTCNITGKVCNFVCNFDSYDKLITAKAVQKLRLKIENHPKPYKLQWLKKAGDVIVSKRVHVSFSVGNTYQDNFCFDVVLIDACHLLLDELEMGDDVFVQIGKEVAEDSEFSKAMIPLLEDFSNVFPCKKTTNAINVAQLSIGNLLRCLMGDHVKAWDQKLCQAEFAHNHVVNRSTGFSPFQVVYSV